VRNLELKTTCYEFTAIPKTSVFFGGKYVNSACNKKYGPAYNIIYPVKIHNDLVFNGDFGFEFLLNQFAGANIKTTGLCFVKDY
jgi:hypothetical protein